MLYLLAFFIPPLALLLAGMPFQAILSFVIWISSFFGLFFFISPGVFLWAVAVIHAVLMIQNRRANRRARQIIEAIERRG
jgi:tetrahydromethanopterin S-methyltransferase subunit E